MSPKIFDTTGREVVDIVYDKNMDGERYVLHAVYLDDGSSVPDEELDYIQDEVLCL